MKLQTENMTKILEICEAKVEIIRMVRTSPSEETSPQSRATYAINFDSYRDSFTNSYCFQPETKVRRLDALNFTENLKLLLPEENFILGLGFDLRFPPFQ